MERVDQIGEPIKDRPHYVYRAYAADGHLLYVGCTFDVLARLKNHSSASNWWPHHVRVDVEGPFPFDVARQREADAIQTEHPTYNADEPHRGAHNGRWDRISELATTIAARDNWTFNDCYDIGASTANLFLKRVGVGYPFEWRDDIGNAEAVGNFMQDPIPYTWAGMKTLICAGWKPATSLNPHWRLLPYEWDSWEMGHLPRGLRLYHLGDHELSQHREIIDVLRARKAIKLPRIEVTERYIRESDDKSDRANMIR